MKNIPIGEVLKQYGYITDEQVAQALAFQKTEEGKNRRLGDLLLDLGFVTQRQVLEALGKKLNYELIDFRNIKVDVDTVQKVPKALALKYNILPICERGGRFVIVMSDPLNFYAQEDIRQLVDMPLEIVLAEKEIVTERINYYYNEVNAKMAAQKANISAASLDIPQGDEDEDNDDESAPIVKLVNSLLVRGYSANASDIHIEPFETFTNVRMRVDGMIVDFVTIQKALHSSIVARIKIMSDLDIAEKRVPQDGNFRVKLDGYDISVRVSVIPTVHGEKVVMRYLSSDTVIDNPGHYGMSEYHYDMLCKMLQAPNGIVYITGPTGSGKTTTLYMVLSDLSKRQVNISTIEDPVEKGLPRINQTSVNNTAGLTFSTGLRALLRQDPDIIMIGETRDAETAEISVRAAITGHLVISTLHTNDALSSIVRLEDMGLPPYMVANSVVGLVAQRLVRKVCASCAYETEPTAEESAVIGEDIKVVRKGKGCHLCNNTGFKGRIAIHEMVYIDKELKRMVAKSADMDEMQRYVEKNQNFVTLKQSAINLVKQGITTPDEVMRVAYYSD